MKLAIQLTSPPDREKIVAELWYGNQQWGEVSWEAEKPMLEVYSKSDAESKEFWIFELDEVLEALNEAKKRLMDSSSISE